MEKLDDSALQQRITEETTKIKVGSYQKIASLGGWSGGYRTLWAVAAIGAVSGAAIGVLAPFFPLLVGASSIGTALGALGASVATFATVGMGMGFSGGLILGRISGVSTSVAHEQEKRLKEWTTKQLLQANPNAKIYEDREDEKKVKAYKPFWKASHDTYRTYINPRVGAFFTAAGAIGGLIMAAAFVTTGGAAGAVMPALETITGLSSATLLSPGVMAAYAGGVMAAFGALANFNFPKIVSDLTELSGKFVSGEKLGRTWGPQEKEPSQSLEKDYGLTATEKNACKNSCSGKQISYQDKVRQSQSQPSELTRS